MNEEETTSVKALSCPDSHLLKRMTRKLCEFTESWHSKSSIIGGMEKAGISKCTQSVHGEQSVADTQDRAGSVGGST